MSLDRWNAGLTKQANVFKKMYQSPFAKNLASSYSTAGLNAVKGATNTLNRATSSGNIAGISNAFEIAATNPPVALGLAGLALTRPAFNAFKKTIAGISPKAKRNVKTTEQIIGGVKQGKDLADKAGQFAQSSTGQGIMSRAGELAEAATSVFFKSASEGHWRKLPADYKGKDPNGNPVQGKTWVSKSRLKTWFKPFKHQAQFLKRVKKLPKEGGGLIAAHGTGTGKTITAVAAFENMKDQGRAKRALVITPAGLRNNFLENGVEKFTGSKGVILKNAKKDIPDETEYVIVSYEAFRANPDSFIEKYKPDVLIADEFHRAGNPSSTTHKAIMSAREKVPYFIGLTASIAQNNPSDVAPLLRLSSSGKSPISDKKKFKKRFVKKTSDPKQRGIFGGRTYEKRLVNTDRLKKILGADIHYLEDLDADKKPTKEVETVPVQMSKQQVQIYKDAMSGIDPVLAAKIGRGQAMTQRDGRAVFLKLMRARRVSNSLHETVPGMTLEQAATDTPKIKKILDDVDAHIKSTKDGKIIIYTNIIKGGVDVIEAGLKERGVPYGRFIGKGNKGVTEETRQQAVRDYKAGKNKVILITGAGAEGLSLGNTTMVMLADGHYNPQRISQAEARGVRAGGLSHRPKEERKVQVRRYVSALPKTFFQKVLFQPASKGIDEWVYATAARKARVNKQLRDVLNEKSKEVDSPSFVDRLFGD